MIRKDALEYGRRLDERGSIDSAYYVFWLYLDDISVGMVGKISALSSSSAEQRTRAGRRSCRHRSSPPGGDTCEAAMMTMFGEPAEPSADPNVVTGIGASARSKVRKGDIMVCQMTMPAWTPLFSIASAVVTNTGGVLSHCAIVSREYWMPTVVGTAVGTAVLKDGIVVMVDGASGMVRIDSH